MNSAASLPPLLGESPAWLAAMDQVSAAAGLDRPMLVIGERGSGKELVAARLHFLSPRWSGPYVKLNCAALSEELLESELFGHEQGAFTGATRRLTGRFERANGGSLFLDELATASLRVQEKILRVIEYGEFERVGGEKTLSVDVRVIGATNVDLPARAAAGEFRADLLDRLAFDVITLPPLRARPQDIVLLADHFGAAMAKELGERFMGFSPEATGALLAYPWPGNVRELKNVAERAVYRALAEENGRARPVRHLEIDPFASPFRPTQTPTVAPAPASAPAPRMMNETLSFSERVSAFEKHLVEDALKSCDNHQGKSAEFLGLRYDQFRGLLKKYGLKGRLSP
jgi:psp operon transcriptional activator